MAAECTPTATATLYTLIPSTSTSSTFTSTVTTLDPVVTTITEFVCEDSGDPDEPGCVSSAVEVESTLFAGGPTTVQVPIEIIFDITQASPTATLFATCSTTVSVAAPTSDTPPPTTTTALITTFVTPEPSVIVISGSSTLPDGSVVLVMTTSTSTSPPLSVVMPKQPGPPPANNVSHGSGSKDFIGPVVGGILGGFFGLIGLALIIWFSWRRRMRILAARPPSPDPLDMVYRSPRESTLAGDNTERKPYYYGALVGGSRNSHGSSRPGSPRNRSSVYSQGGTSHPMHPPSPGLSYHQGSPPPTPPFFPSTAVQPGASLPSSRPSTPGYFPATGPPSAFTRQSWPRYDDQPDSAQEFGVRRERKPSRLSLTLSNCEGVQEAQERPKSAGRRSTGGSLSGVSPNADVVRSPSTSTEVHINERSRSTLFIVNSEDPKSV